MSEERHFQITVLLTVRPQTKTAPEDVADAIEKHVTTAVELWYEDYGQPRNLVSECPSVHLGEIDP